MPNGTTDGANKALDTVSDIEYNSEIGAGHTGKANPERAPNKAVDNGTDIGYKVGRRD